MTDGNGIVYGIGVGPGDPELLTLKAWRILSSVQVIAYPKTASGDALARGIVSPFVPEDVQELAFEVPMAAERQPAAAAYDKAAAMIGEHLRDGRDVAVLCEGDPFFYGSFMYLHQRLQAKYKVVVVPGVTSLTASAAALARPLAARNEVLKVLPAPLDLKTLEREIAGAEAVAIIKVETAFRQGPPGDRRSRTCRQGRGDRTRQHRPAGHHAAD